jgi:hypothetical protein
VQFASSQNKQSFYFEDLLWHIRSNLESQGPGDNIFGMHTRNVIISQKNCITLTIKNYKGKPCCAEIYTDQYINEGTIETTIQTNLKKFTPDLVFGIFIYDGTAPPYYNEVDIEYALWGNKERKIAQYALHTENGIISHHFDLPRKKVLTKHIIRVTKHHILISTLLFNKSKKDFEKVTEKTFTRPYNFTFKKTRFRYNLWLTKEKSSKTRRYSNVKIKSFNYTPAQNL